MIGESVSQIEDSHFNLDRPHTNRRTHNALFDMAMMLSSRLALAALLLSSYNVDAFTLLGGRDGSSRALTLNQHIGSGGMADTRNPDAFNDEDPRKSISAAPSFEEYLKQRSNEGTTAAVASHNNKQGNEMSRADLEASYLLKNQYHLAEDPSTTHAQTLASRGCARVDKGLSISTAQNLQQFIDDTLEVYLEEVNSFVQPRNFRFANVLEKQNRFDMLLPFDDNAEIPSSSPVMDAMGELLLDGGKIFPIISELLGEDAVLYELACLISDPGSKRQEIHPDIVFRPGSIPLVACFVSLQDIDATMGPTVFIPDTVSEDHHRRINDSILADEMLKTIPSCISTLDMGDCSLYNPMVLHAGGGNESDRRRRLFYFTFLRADVDDPSSDFNPGSINPVLKQRNLTLAQVREALKSNRQRNS